MFLFGVFPYFCEKILNFLDFLYNGTSRSIFPVSNRHWASLGRLAASVALLHLGEVEEVQMEVEEMAHVEMGEQSLGDGRFLLGYVIKKR